MGWGDDSVLKSSGTQTWISEFRSPNTSEEPEQWLVTITEHCWKRCEDRLSPEAHWADCWINVGR